jgi:hypothetical protein
MKNKFNSLNTELNPICHLLVLLGAHPILHISRIRVNKYVYIRHTLICVFFTLIEVTNSWANIKCQGKLILKCTLQSVYFVRSRTNSVTMNTSKIMSGTGTFFRVQNVVIQHSATVIRQGITNQQQR